MVLFWGFRWVGQAAGDLQGRRRGTSRVKRRAVRGQFLRPRRRYQWSWRMGHGSSSRRSSGWAQWQGHGGPQDGGVDVAHPDAGRDDLPRRGGQLDAAFAVAASREGHLRDLDHAVATLYVAASDAGQLAACELRHGVRQVPVREAASNASRSAALRKNFMRTGVSGVTVRVRGRPIRVLMVSTSSGRVWVRLTGCGGREWGTSWPSRSA
jgi:hypothetical protein